jgi:hypothetical protein
VGIAKTLIGIHEFCQARSAFFHRVRPGLIALQSTVSLHRERLVEFRPSDTPSNESTLPAATVARNKRAHQQYACLRGVLHTVGRDMRRRHPGPMPYCTTRPHSSHRQTFSCRAADRVGRRRLGRGLDELGFFVMP